jgi:hypothetical protein
MTMEVKKSVEKRVEHQAGDNVAKVETQEPKVAAPEPQVAPVVLDPHVMLAIQTSVQEAMKTAVGIIVEQLKPSTLPSTPAPAIPVRNAGAPNPAPVNNGNYVSKLKGIPVEPGQDLRHVHPSVIQNWFNTVENRWKEAYNKRKIGGAPVDMSWTRG